MRDNDDESLEFRIASFLTKPFDWSQEVSAHDISMMTTGTAATAGSLYLLGTWVWILQRSAERGHP